MKLDNLNSYYADSRILFRTSDLTLTVGCTSSNYKIDHNNRTYTLDDHKKFLNSNKDNAKINAETNIQNKKLAQLVNTIEENLKFISSA